MFKTAELAKTVISVAVVIPCYRVRKHILSVISEMPEFVDHIIVVDDKCPEQSGELVRDSSVDPRVTVVFHEKNQGVGGAVVSGYRRAMEFGADVAVKVDGDGQMDPSLMAAFIQPIAMGLADYTKGNRFFSLDTVAGMPAIRLFGNAMLSFISKLSTGYWRTFDPTNGYTAIHCSVLSLLPLHKLIGRYFFESEMLFRLGTIGAAVTDVPMHSRYADETSGLKLSKILGEFAWKHMRNAFKRIAYNYALRDFSVATIEFVAGIGLLLFGLVFGVHQIIQSNLTGEITSPGTVAVAMVTVILGIQFILAFLAFDISRTPSTPIHLTLSSGLKRPHGPTISN